MVSKPITRRVVLGSLAIGAVSSPVSAAPAVDLALVLAIDCSYSVDALEYQQQMQGTARALMAPEILQAITGGARKRIAISAFLWSDPLIQFVIVPWQLLQNAEDAKAVAHVFLRSPRDVPKETTATGSALLFAQSLLLTAPPAFRRVIDISTDGECNSGPKVNAVRDAIVAQGTVINGLAITKDTRDLDNYLRENVIGGDQSFVIKATDFDAYGESLREKLFREITNVDLI